MPIRVLPPLLVSQIAAGEVVERPANVVKELVENSLDAGAARIVVEIEGGGRDLVRVSDDGGGIPAEELPLAVAAHATSKIGSVEDLGRIRSMGFRGEALSAIAAVSRLEILSRPHGAAHAATIEAEGERLSAVRPAAGPPGTTVTVRSLFFNTPARRKFLRSDRAESARVADMLSAIAMAHPDVAFELRQDGRRTLAAPAQAQRERVLTLMGEELAEEMLEVRDESGAGPAGDREGGWLRIWGLAGTPSLARPTGRHLRLYLNRRPIVDRSLTHAVRDAYRGLIDPARHPTAALFLDMDPAHVDVNVHPTKSEVRFRDAGALHSAVRRAVMAALRAADLVPTVALDRAATAWPGADGRASVWPGSSPTPHDGAGALGGGGAPAWTGRTGSGASGASGGAPRWGGFGMPVEEARRALAESSGLAANPSGEPPAAPVQATLRATLVERVLQIHDKYLVVEDPEGMLVIDQHALHERVMFERLRERLAAGPLESQRLLLPATVAADRARQEALEEMRPLLAALGIEAAPSGPSTIAVQAFPSLLFSRGVAPAAFLQELLDRVGSDELTPGPEEAMTDVLAMMACKAAVKAGDRLRPGEIDELLRLREQIERSSACPHGRPTSLRLTLRDLDRQFGR